MSDTALIGDGAAGVAGDPGDGGVKSAEGALQPWLAQAVDEQKRNEYLGTFKTVTDANKAHLALVEKVKGSIKIPDSTTSEEELKAFRKANGVPDTVDGYKFDEAQLPEGMTMDAEQSKWFKEIAHKLGLNQHQANTLFAEESKRRIQSHNTATEGIKKGVDTVKQKWGVDFDANLAVANRAVSKFGSIAFPEFLKKSGLGNNPEMLEFCLSVGKGMSEDKLTPGQGPGGTEAKERRYPNSPKMYDKK